MKRLTLIRHAESSWADEKNKDIDRYLKEQGKKDAKIMGEKVLAGFSRPDAFFISSALRTRETAAIFLDILHYPPEILHYFSELYTFEWHELLSFIRKTDDSLESIFILGHNPALTELINYLSWDKKLPNLPTSGICSLILEVDSWKDVRKDCGEMILYHYPKEYRAESE